jgi:hypothetical protein
MFGIENGILPHDSRAHSGRVNHAAQRVARIQPRVERSDTLGNGCDLNLRPEGAREFPMPAETMIVCENLTKRFDHFTAVVEA